MITTKEFAEIAAKHQPKDDTEAEFTAEELVEQIEKALASSAPDESAAAKALKNIVEEIWQHGYDQGKLAWRFKQTMG